MPKEDSSAVVSGMQDPEADNQATSDLLSRQFTALGAALSDEAPAVRAGAVQGTAALLHRFWELVPAGLSAALLTRLAGEHPHVLAAHTAMPFISSQHTGPA